VFSVKAVVSFLYFLFYKSLKYFEIKSASEKPAQNSVLHCFLASLTNVTSQGFIFDKQDKVSHQSSCEGGVSGLFFFLKKKKKKKKTRFFSCSISSYLRQLVIILHQIPSHVLQPLKPHFPRIHASSVNGITPISMEFNCSISLDYIPLFVGKFDPV